MEILHQILRALATTGQMAWQIGWSLILGFGIASVVQALIRKETVASLLPDSRPGSVVKAAGLGDGVLVLFLRGGGLGPDAGP